MADPRMGILKGFFGDDVLCSTMMELEDTGKCINIRDMLLSFGMSEQYISAFISEKSEYVSVDGSLLPSFIAKYKGMVKDVAEIKSRYKEMKKNISLVGSVPVDGSFDYLNTAECICKNRKIVYTMPEDFRISYLDFNNVKLGFYRVVSISESFQIPFTLLHTLVCGKCGEIVLSERTDVIKCKNCGKLMKCDPSLSEKIPFYMTRVYTGGNFVDVYSPMRLPVNQVDVAAIPFEIDKKYALLALACKVPKPFEFELKWSDGDRVVQMMNMIDEYHRQRVGKYFSGLDHIKIALLYMGWARRCGYVNSNMLVVGPPGCGKSTLSKYYGFTLFADSLYTDASSTTIPGLIGSGEVVDSGGSRTQTFQPGILERYDYVVIDELLDKPKNELDELKAILEMNMVKSQKHNNKRNVPRRAVVIVASNIPGIHSKNVANMRRMMEGTIGVQDDICNMSLTMRSQFTSNNVNWRDGIQYPVLDRFSFIFYLKKRGSAIGINKAIMDGDDGSIREDVLYALLRTDVFSDYLDAVAKINVNFKFDVDGFDGDKIDKLLKKYKMLLGSDTGGFGDDIHSLERLQRNLMYMVRFHATMNLRDKSDESDYEFVDKLYSMTCNFVNIEDLIWDKDKKLVDSEGSVDGMVTNFIVNYLDSVESKAAMLTDMFSACSMAGYKPEIVKRVLDLMVSGNMLIFEPPSRYRLP